MIEIDTSIEKIGLANFFSWQFLIAEENFAQIDRIGWFGRFD
jgi:hypothetical protein